MPRFELKNRFWEGWLDGTTVVTRQGSLSGNGRASHKTLASVDKAQKELAKRIAATLDKGYLRTAPEVSEELPADVIAAIAADPRDDAGYLVAADALQAVGHPRGELIMLQHAREAKPQGKMAKLGRGEAALLEAHASLALPPRFAEALRKPKRSDKAPSGYCHAEWRCGYLRSATIGRNATKPPYTVRELTLELLTHPSARFLAELTIGALGGKEDYAYADIVEALLIARPTTLRTLHLADFDAQEHSDPSRASLGELGRLGEAAPELEELTLRAGSLSLEGLSLPRLRLLRIETVLNAPLLADILALSLPALETLELSCSGYAISAAELAPLFNGAFPHLRRLALRQTTGTNALLEALLGASMWLSTLAELDLSAGTVDDEGGERLWDERELLGHLRRLDLRANQLSAALVERLAGLAGEVMLDGQSAAAAGPTLLTFEAIRDVAADARSISNARALADEASWRSLGVAGERLWGECRGSSTYATIVELPALSSTCSCPSHKLPCKHAIALMLLAAEGRVAEGAMPADFVDRANTTQW